MSKKPFLALAVAVLAATSCATQVAPERPAPVEGPGIEIAAALPFAVPEGALFVARSRNSATLYRITETCDRLHELNPRTVVFFWTLDAGVRSGYRLADDEGCR